MDLNIKYGRKDLVIQLPDSVKVFETKGTTSVSNESLAIKSALNKPYNKKALCDLVRPGMKIVISHTDITRATPNDRMLPVLLEVLRESGIRRQDIILLNSPGTHRLQTRNELITMLGVDIYKNYDCRQHNAFDDSELIFIGETKYGNPIEINRLLLESDLNIFTGFIEPHFFAGFSGGPKAILPGLSAAESVFANHSYEMISHPNATFNITNGNPIWEEMKEVSQKISNSFLLNVTLNRQNQISGVYAGDIISAHKKGCDYLRETNRVIIEVPYDIVITTNGGYPLDQNLYQCVKGLAVAKRAVKKGGAIFLLAACEEGLPDDSIYAKILNSVKTPKAALEKISQKKQSIQDAWQVQVQANIQLQADVYVYSNGLNNQQITDALMKPARNIASTLDMLMKTYGDRICVLPEGPLVIVD